MYSISELNGIKIYNLSAGKSANQFIEEAATKRKSLRYNQEFRKRIELIQDFEFPISSQRIKISENQQHIVASGLYAPQVKIFDTTDLSLKCMRGMDSEVVQFSILSPDFSKLAFICADRSLEFHAQYGRHYKTRVPKCPRELSFNPHTGDLIIAGSSEDVWRISLDEGKFLAPLVSDCHEINALDYNPYLNILMVGGEHGIIETWDYRERAKVNKVVANKGAEITVLNHDESGFLFGSGSKDGLVRLYDIRYSSHVLEMQHPYRLPIKTLKFHEPTKTVLSVDKKMIKIYNKTNGKIFTNVESNSDINDVELVADSGLLLVANEETRIGTYFIPELGPAPKWCPFLENVTEELEEELTSTVYDEYKFVTKEDLEALNATHLIGSKYLKQYLHGFLLKSKMYIKLKDAHDPFAYQRYKEERVKKAMEEKTANRIVIPKKKPKINQELIDELEAKNALKIKKKFNPSEVLKDNRFADLFNNPEFAIDRESDAYKLNHPSAAKRMGRKLRDEESDGEEDDGEDQAINLKIKDLDNARKSQKATFQARLLNEKNKMNSLEDGNGKKRVKR